MIGLVIGIPGVGKTSVIKEAKKYCKKKFTVVNFGDVVFELVKDKFDLRSRDEIRKKVKYLEYKKFQLEACKKICKEAEGLVLIDTHFLIKTTFGYLPGTSREMIRELDPKFVVVVTADPKDILSRRKSDETRDRDLESIDEIKLHQDLTINYALSIAYDAHIPIAIIKNEEGKLEEAGKKLAEVLNNLEDA